MYFKIERGLFKYEFADHYAVLGVPLEANPDQIRERYKYVARQLHPDSCKAASAKEREFATQLFSKLVSPAYAHLSREQQRTEYKLVFKQIGRNIAQGSVKDLATGEFAQKLQQQTNVNQLDLVYRDCWQKLAAQQYKIVSQSLDIIASLSELNLVYMVTKEVQTSPPAIKMPESTSNQATGGLVEQYLRRANDHIASKNFARAILELRDAINLEPNNSTCNSLLAKAYLQQNQGTMANMYITKALNLNPQDPIALDLKKILDKSKNPAKAEKRGFLDGIFRANQK
ncbi:J domain-containing protein [Merismopedia glauca]|uniref:Molecular chaperone DnaJ n=1 Tax=Merismopedia glauca CCAP 1448/3 TaxID=1296344 RepID=A0A2T1C454_9CYAN|nr:DnaJ domain-containing protein [Merismopedia glauca]PSB02903.1 molecular chaperone DnaJ [Merismopedia glauca CCAP 1448/3]